MEAANLIPRDWRLLRVVAPLHTRAAVRGAFAVVVCLLAAGCRSPGASGVEGDWWVEPRAVDLGPAYLGTEVRGTVTVRSATRAGAELRVQVAPPFSAAGALLLPGGAEVQLEVAYRPGEAREDEGELLLTDGAREVRVALRGQGLEAPECAAPAACVQARFDAAQGRCVEEPLADGTPCAAACLVEASCWSGVCVGAAKSCDDGNACTHDSCGPDGACRHEDGSAACPAPADPCQVAVCRPDTGCGADAAPDGTACGPNDCTTARVCMGGACVTRASPEGSQCAPAGLCQAASTCRASQCVAGATTTLPERWRYAPQGKRLFFEGTVGPDGTVYFSESSQTDPDSPLELVALDRFGAERFRVELERPCTWCGARLMLDPDGQRLFAGRGGRVQARSLVDGRLLWARDTTQGRALRSPRPDGGAVFSSSAFFGLTPDVVVQELTEGYELHREYSVALDRRSGQVAWERDWWGHVYGPGVTAAGELWMAASDCWAPLQQSQVLGPAGATLRTVVRQARPLAYVDDRVLLDSRSDLVWASPQGLGATLPSSAAGANWALAAPDRTVLASYNGAQELSDDGGRRWGRGFPGYLAWGALLRDGGTLLAAHSGDGGSGLYAVDGAGQAVFACPLPGIASAGAPHAGLWVAQVTRGMAEAIVAFEVPGAELEPRGWTLPGGSPLNDRRAR